MLRVSPENPQAMAPMTWKNAENRNRQFFFWHFCQTVLLQLLRTVHKPTYYHPFIIFCCFINN